MKNLINLFVIFICCFSYGQSITSSNIKGKITLIYYYIYNDTDNREEFKIFKEFEKLDPLIFTLIGDNLIDFSIYYKLHDRETVGIINEKTILEFYLNKIDYEEIDYHEHLVELYLKFNPHLSWIKKSKFRNRVDLISKFLTYADQMDAEMDKDFYFDLRVRINKPKELFALAVGEKIRCNVLRFNKRNNEQWIDVRSLIKDDYYIDQILSEELKELKQLNIPIRDKIEIISQYIQDNVKYHLSVLEGNFQDFWQYPSETIRWASGDCEDFAILFQCIAEYINLDTRVVLGWYKVKEGMIYAHAWIKYKNEFIIETTNGNIHEFINNKHYNEVFSFNSKE